MKKWAKIIIALFILCIAFFIYLNNVAQMPEPDHRQIKEDELVMHNVNDSLIRCDDSWLKLNKYGLWELFVQGDPYTMGYKNGLLTQKLVRYQEESFVAQIDQLVPSRGYLQFLRLFLGWFNRDLLKHIPLEYQQEVAGVSKFASNEFNFIAPPFQRIMSYHGAHDMGHALQSMCLVGCTSFGVWDEYSNDSSLIIGRNFDFYAGDRFSENKIIAFMKPDEGFPFMSVTWGGMIGVVSGMNTEGLTITLNAEPTGIPSSSKTPVSILARKILQYASTIDEAFAIAQQYETFVSESFLIGSGKENCVALIEKTPEKISLLRPQNNFLAVTNHFLDTAFVHKNDTISKTFIDASHYRLNRVEAMIDSIHSFSVDDAAYLLRDRNGTDGTNIGSGNEKAINQLIAHHGIIFKPQEKKVWISAAPFQLGAFVSYDLDEIFDDPQSYSSRNTFSLYHTIAPDSMLQTPAYHQFLKYKETLHSIQKDMDDEKTIEASVLKDFISLNDHYYYPWMIVGNYYFEHENYKLAHLHYTQALQLEIPQEDDYSKLVLLQAKCKKKLEN